MEEEGWGQGQAHSGGSVGTRGEHACTRHGGCPCVTQLARACLSLAREGSVPPSSPASTPLSPPRVKLAPLVLVVPKALKVLVANLVLLGPPGRLVPP